jgi:membrane protein DedA with SNARE-associated domain
MSWAIAAAAAFILATEGGVPIPVPADVVLLGLGERAGSGSVPLWAVMVSLEVVVISGTSALFLVSRKLGGRALARLSRRPSVGNQIERVRRIVARRGTAAFAAGRATPGLRTITVLIAALSTVAPGVALLALIAGGSVFVQGHVLLGYTVGPAARDAIDTFPVVGIALVVVLVAVAAVAWFARRGRRAGGRGWAEGACPACLVLGLPGGATGS